jgi:hypothetical protein
MLFWGIVVFLLGAVIIGVGKRMLFNDVVGLIGLAMLMAGTILAAYAVISPLWKQAGKSVQETEAKSTRELETGAHTLAEGLPAPPPGMTEQTTKILETEGGKKRKDDSSKEAGV